MRKNRGEEFYVILFKKNLQITYIKFDLTFHIIRGVKCF